MSVFEALFETVFVPPAVIQELSHPKPGVRAVDPLAVSVFVLQSPVNMIDVAALRQKRLGAGEAEALVVAREVGADAVVLDDEAARKAARAMGFRIVGALGLWCEAKRHGLTPTVAPLIDRLEREIQFRVSAALRRAVLKSAGE